MKIRFHFCAKKFLHESFCIQPHFHSEEFRNSEMGIFEIRTEIQSKMLKKKMRTKSFFGIRFVKEIRELLHTNCNVRIFIERS